MKLPLLKKKPAPPARLTPALHTEPAPYYQAIGWVFGSVSKYQDGEKQRLKIDLPSPTGAVIFALTGQPGVLKLLHHRLEQAVSSENTLQLWVKCYPKYNLKESRLYFHLIYFSPLQVEDSPANIFTLRGILQFIPQSRRPVVSIYRNKQHGEGDRLKTSHIPILHTSRVVAFKFKKNSDERPQFFQIEAKLLPDRGCFAWERLLAEPSTPPKRMRAKV